MSEPTVVTMVSSDTHMVHGEVVGLDDVTMPGGQRWRPSEITLTWFDGRLHAAHLSGQVYKRNGEKYANGREYSVSYMTWDSMLEAFTLSPTAPQWVIDLVKAHEPR